MTKQELWLKLVEKNPEFETQGGNFTARGLRKFFDTVWTEGYRAGRQEPESVPDFLKGLFV
jgi:hypothetical protein